MDMHKTEHVAEALIMGAVRPTCIRRRVPGGWIYVHYDYYGAAAETRAAVFVPDSATTPKEG